MTTALRLVRSAAEGLAYEYDLFTAKGPQVGIWTATDNALVCPRAYRRRDGFDRACEASAARGWPVFQRPTGGGVVPQGPMVSNLALAFDAPKTFKIEDGYRLLVGVIKAGLGGHGVALETGETPRSFCNGTWNLSVGSQKIVGTAQRWRPVPGGLTRVLAHALILVHDTHDVGADAVSAFHNDLGLAPVDANAHTSLEAAFGLPALPDTIIRNAATSALRSLGTITTTKGTITGRKPCPTKQSTSI
ncbi:hypothetical protein [Aliiroseovarius sp. F47248L]|uniref:lipoyl protein ligase domain-containing protein n=1 Tax=Aliiroseovarius sp. F47248L TaxID=2926420 RepID=UPI001FF5574A|nr:hypothetical protein [Aliiroseovarius sp. F47248L]MCK0139865.1 hypothetical protein [Aliiroseovarius sp. F47248L]